MKTCKHTTEDHYLTLSKFQTIHSVILGHNRIVIIVKNSRLSILNQLET